jgi:hypothetical protein
MGLGENFFKSPVKMISKIPSSDKKNYQNNICPLFQTALTKM